MIEVSYDYYKNEYKSSLDEETFNKFVRRSYIYINNFCYGNFERVNASDFSDFQLESIRFCICAVTDKIAESTNENGVVQSSSKKAETVGPWSVTYSDDSNNKTFISSLKEICLQYLLNTGLMVSWI